MILARCPACASIAAGPGRLCPLCGTALQAPASLEEQRDCLAELHAAVARADAEHDPMNAARIQDRLLREGYLPDDSELLLREMDLARRMMTGMGDFSGGAGARYQACISRYEIIRRRVSAEDSANPAAVQRQRRLIWRILARAPIRPALRLLGSLLAIVAVRLGRLLKIRRPARVLALSSSSAAAKIPG